VRFEHVLARVGAQGRPRWDALAADAGYADQPHVTREVRLLSGVTPGRLAEERRAG
jgi:hypothetical protein